MDILRILWASQVTLMANNLPSYARDIRYEFDPWIGKSPLEEYIASHSNILAWRIPCMDRQV